VGSRVFYVLGHLSEFSSHWSGVFDINTAGLVYYGGLLFALPAAVITIRILKMPTSITVGAIGLAIPLSLGIARFGCFLNGCCGGKPSGLPWAVTFPGTATSVHPTQLYEAVLDIALFAALLLVGTRFLEGWELLLCSLAGYALIRFLMEFFRLHANPRAGLFFQLFSVAVFVACAGALGVIIGVRHRDMNSSTSSRQSD
jgi:phosphatidylglycerol:prolipoprotein diacylglycerol transferase